MLSQVLIREWYACGSINNDKQQAWLLGPYLLIISFSSPPARPRGYRFTDHYYHCACVQQNGARQHDCCMCYRKENHPSLGHQVCWATQCNFPNFFWGAPFELWRETTSSGRNILYMYAINFVWTRVLTRVLWNTYPVRCCCCMKMYVRSEED